MTCSASGASIEDACARARWRPILAGALLILVANVCEARTKTHMVKSGRVHREQSATIGVATQDADGTYILQLRAQSPDGTRGDALIRYPRDDPHYAEIARHIGPVPAGKWVGVKPFPAPEAR
jgi:hypothetical protein